LENINLVGSQADERKELFLSTEENDILFIRVLDFRKISKLGGLKERIVFTSCVPDYRKERELEDMKVLDCGKDAVSE